MAEISMRHIEEFVKRVMSGEDLGQLLRTGLEAALSAIMEGEISEQLGAGYHERSDGRQGYRNGYRRRRFDTGLGTTELKIPRPREGSYFPSFLKSRERSDGALQTALVECYEQGVSTRRAEAVAQALGVDSISKSTVSRLVKVLDPAVKAFRERELSRCPYVFVDARYEHVREDHAVRKVAVMVALGVREDGGREVLGFRTARTENQAWWGDFLKDLKRRGLDGVKLVVSDAHEGLRRAIGEVLPEAKWQRCKVHFLRNLGSRLPKKKRPGLLALTKMIFEMETLDEARVQRRKVATLFREAGHHDAADCLEGADEVLTYLEFPEAHRSKLHSTNVVERLNRELKRRTRLVSIFPDRASLERLVGALLLEEHEEWMVSRRYISERSMASLKSPEEQLEALAPGASELLAANAS
ncbi:MAG: IS256 family transposase [Bacteroidetes bacterium]|nr:MAG: IS256 family transposase [Bacteroidota bacterium]